MSCQRISEGSGSNCKRRFLQVLADLMFRGSGHRMASGGAAVSAHVDQRTHSLSETFRLVIGLSLASRKRAQKSVAPPPLMIAARMTLRPLRRVSRLDTPSSITV